MLDEREAPVASEERHRAFNNQSLRVRVAVVAAGPIANLLLAVLLYAAVDWWGVQEPRPVLAAPVAGSVAEKSGLAGGDRVMRAAFDDEPLAPVQSFEDVRWLLTRAALDRHDVRLEIAQDGRRGAREVVMPLAQLHPSEADASLFRRIGILGPFTRPELGDVVPGSPADRAGLRKGDVVLRLGDIDVADGQQLREWIRSQAGGATTTWRVQRQGSAIELQVRPDTFTDGGRSIGRIGAYVGAPPEMMEVRHGPIDGLRRAVVKTWDVSLLTLRMMGRMVVGQASLKNLSGPLTIADYAGKSASMGMVQYLVFLAMVSVSLGVLNLLPLPVLDGGHLMYYLWEAVTGRSVSEAWMERLQRGGVAVLLAMMSIALFNDVTRLFG
jgi:regulator of sigma E protease